MKISTKLNRIALRTISLAALILVMINWSGQSTHAQSPLEADEVAAALSAGSTARVIVAFHSSETRARIGVSTQQISRIQNNVLREVSAEDFRLIHRYETLPGLIGEVTEAGLDILLNQPEVAAVALDLPVEAVLTESAALINADDVFNDLGVTGLGVNVALLDTGVDTTHPDLAGNIVAQHCFNQSGCPPNDTVEGDNAQDENGHGTHIAGVIAGQGDTSPRGIASEAGLVAVRVMGSNGVGFTSDVLAGIDWVVANQATLEVKVMNLSLGGGSYSGICDQADANTMLYAAAVKSARQAGITIFAASGNSGKAEAMLAPACVSGVTSIGNVYDTDLSGLNWPTCKDEAIVADQVACSSNSSLALDLLAPGVLVNSTRLGGGQSSKSGTSISTAHAAAVAALMLQAKPDLTPDQIDTILKETGAPVADSRNGLIRPRIDALAAVSAVAPAQSAIIAGTILLQGRPDQSGANIFLSEQPCAAANFGDPAAVTDAAGAFEIVLPSGQVYQCLQAKQVGYLVGQREMPAGNLGTIHLPGGDVTGDNQVDIFDLAFIAGRHDSTDPFADINGDGLVDIFDLVIAAGNYNQQGPVTNWQ